MHEVGINFRLIVVRYKPNSTSTNSLPSLTLMSSGSQLSGDMHRGSTAFNSEARETRKAVRPEFRSNHDHQVGV
jgi:hypothetical protein